MQDTGGGGGTFFFVAAPIYTTLCEKINSIRIRVHLNTCRLYRLRANQLGSKMTNFERLIFAEFSVACAIGCITIGVWNSLRYQI